MSPSLQCGERPPPTVPTEEPNLTLDCFLDPVRAVLRFHPDKGLLHYLLLWLSLSVELIPTLILELIRGLGPWQSEIIDLLTQALLTCSSNSRIEWNSVQLSILSHALIDPFLSVWLEPEVLRVSRRFVAEGFGLDRGAPRPRFHTL